MYCVTMVLLAMSMWESFSIPNMTAQESTRSFWERFDVSEGDRVRCLNALPSRYEGWLVQELGDQGYCSLTLLVCGPEERRSSSTESFGADENQLPGPSRIVQIRPARYALDLDIAGAAKETYPSLAPSIRSLDLDLHLKGKFCVYEMQRMTGTPLSRALPRCQNPSSTVQRKQESLIESFAAMVAQGLKPSIPKDRTVRADSPMEDIPSIYSQCTGKVGSTIVSRLEKLRKSLPEGYLSGIASETLACVRSLKDYPVVLNHGDLIPSNVLVDEETWKITGLVDWAEAEYLPFGTCLYGLEHLLGHMSTSASPAFTYYENASQLRELFWRRLFDLVPWLKSREGDVRIMRKLGILLWYGFAWDDGAIDRVVNDVDDPAEMVCLRAFLQVE